MNHHEAWNLIPWLVNDSLDEAQRGRLEQHLVECPACRAEVQEQRALLQAMNARPRVEAMPRASLQKLWARLDSHPAPWIRPDAPPVRRRASSPTWIIAAAAGVVLLLGATLVAALRPWQEPAATFRTVSDAGGLPASAAIRAVFAGEMPVAQLQALLEHTGLRIVDGPSASGVYTLAVASATADPRPALALLRAHPAVRFAEPAAP